MKKTVRVIIRLVIILFVLYNFVWAAFVSIKYHPFMECNKGMKAYKTDEYTYYVKKPDYLSFTGNLSITENIVTGYNKDYDYTGSLFIWPKLFNRYNVAFNVAETFVDYEQQTQNTYSYGIMLDENRKPDFNVPGVYELYYEHEDLFNNPELIDKLYSDAYKMWGILGP